MDALLQDLRYALRMLVRMPGLVTVTTLTLGLGIGATTAMFGVVYAALLRPVPFDHPDSLAMLYTTRATPREGLQRTRWSRSEIDALRATASSFEALGSFTSVSLNLTEGEPEQIDGEAASPGYFKTLRVTAARGRTFHDDEDTTPGGHPVALISSRLWQRRFSADSGLIGRTLNVNDVALTIVGVMPEGFFGLTGRADVWVPPTMAPSLTYSDYLTTPQHFINVVARLKSDVPLTRADAELAAIVSRVVRPDSPPGVPVTWGATAWSLGRARIDETVRNSVLVLLAAVACVLVITCVNVAGLLLARSQARRREIAIRLAIGASRGRLIRQSLTESLVLAALGGSLGVFMSMWGIDLIGSPTVIASGRNQFAQLTPFAAPALDATVMLFALAVTLGTVALFGLLPALGTSRSDLVTALKEDSRTGAGHRRVLAGLVVSEVALAVLLLAGAGLLIKSFVLMQELRAGFAPEGVLTFWVTPPALRYRPADGPAIVERLLTSVQRVHGVTSATVNRCTPLDSRCARTTIFFSDGPRDPASAPIVGRHYVSADYFRTLGIPVRAGRLLTDQDREGHPAVTVINETAAQRFWPGENALGKRVWFGSSTGFTDPARPVEVVGVVGDVKYGLVDEMVMPDFYTSYLQFTYPDTMMMVKTTQAPQMLMGSLRAAVGSVDRGLPLYDVQTLDERIGRALSRPRLNATVLGAFALAALVLAAIGVYGVMAYSVSSRLREIGVRLALGADGRRVVRLVLGQGARLAGLGAAIGLAAAFAATRLVKHVLFGVTPTDPIVLAASVLIMVSAALLAALLPARRAGAVDPMVVLRNE